jgi:tetratricopeptide (TPR) repeat protein
VSVAPTNPPTVAPPSKSAQADRYRFRVLFEAFAWADAARALGDLAASPAATDDDRGRVALAWWLAGDVEAAWRALGGRADPTPVAQRTALFAYVRGHLLRIAGQHADAAVAFERAAVASSDSPEALLWWGRTLAHLERWEDAVPIYGRVAARVPGTPLGLAARALLGEALSRSKRMGEGRIVSDGYAVSFRDAGAPSLADEVLVLGPLTTFDDAAPQRAQPAAPKALTWRFRALEERGPDLLTVAFARLGGPDAPGEVVYVSKGAVRAWDPTATVSREVARLPRSAGPSRGLAVADFDADGRLDVWVSGARSQTLALAGRAPMEVLRAGGNAVVPWDLDHDGDLDVLVPKPGGPALARDVGGAVPAYGEAALGAGLASAAARADYLPADLDADGRTDLLAYGGGSLLLLRATRPGGFLPVPAAVPAADGDTLASLGSPTDALVEDLDNDGLADLVTAGPDGVHWARNRGAMRFGAPERIGPATARIAVADVDADGRPDLWALRADGTLSLHRRADEGWDMTAVVTPEPLRSVLVADLDADGLPELVAVGARRLYVVERDGSVPSVAALELRLDTGARNRAGLGARVEVAAGARYLSTTVRRTDLTVPLPAEPGPALVRITWPNAEVQTVVVERPAGGSARVAVAANPLPTDGPTLTVRTAPDAAQLRVAALTDRALGVPTAPGIRPLPGPVQPLVVESEGPMGAALTLELAAGPRDLVYLDSVEVAPLNLDAASTDATWVPVDGALRVFELLEPVEGATDALGADLAPALAAVDADRVGSRPDLRRPGLAAPFTVNLALGPLDPADTPALVVDARRVPPTSTTRFALSWDPTELGPAMRLEGRAASIEWRDVPTTASLAFSPTGARTLVPLTAVPRGDEVHVRWTGRQAVEVDAVRLALDAGEPASLGKPLALTRAVLTAEAPPGPLFEGTTSRLGRLGGRTPEGDAKARVEAQDGRLVVLGPGDRVTLDFDTQALAGPAGRTWVVWLRGERKELDLHAGASGAVGPVPWKGMDQYPRGPEIAHSTADEDAARTRPGPPLLPDPRLRVLEARKSVSP